LIAREYGKYFSDLYDLRLSGDYDDYTEFSKETLQDLLPDAEKFLETIEAILTGKN
jgi:uncharacterized protein (UPF0332 family)